MALSTASLMMNRRLLLVAVLVFGASVVLPGCGLDARFRRTLSSTAAETGGPIVVRSENGRIALSRDESRRDIGITAHVRAQTQERADAVAIEAAAQPDGTLLITTVWPEPGRRGGEGASLEVVVPDAVGLTLETSNGAIECSGAAGLARLRTSNGAIRVEGHEGAVKAETSNGAVRLSNVAGAIEIDTSNASVTVDRARGPVRASSSNGKLNVELLPAAAGPVELDTSNGSITLRVGPGFRGSLSAGTSNGRVQVAERVAKGAAAVQVGKSSATLTFGDGARSTLATSNGTIAIEPAEDAGPVNAAQPAGEREPADTSGR